MTKYIVFTFLFARLLFLPLAAETASLEEINTEAYLSLMDADTLVEENKAEEALPFYKKSLQSYQEIKQKDPSFKPKIVAYRIDLITRKISELSQQLPEGGASKAVIEEEEKDFKALYLQTREEMVRNSNRLLALEKRDIQMSTLLRKRQEELNRLQGLLRDMEKELNTAKAEQGKSTASLQKEINDLSRFNALLQDRADKLEIDTKQLILQRDDLLNEGRELSGNLDEITQEHQALQKELAEFKRNSTLSEQRLILNRNQLQDDLKVLKIELGNTQEKVLELETKTEEVPLLEESVAELTRRNEAQLETIAELTGSLEEIQATMDETQETLAQTTSRYEEALNQIEQLQLEKTEWEAQKQRIADNQKALEEKLQSQEEEVARHLEERKRAEMERAKVLEERSGFRDRIKTHVNEKKELDTKFAETQKVLQNLEQDKVDLEILLEEQKAETEKAQKEVSELKDYYDIDSQELKTLKENTEEWSNKVAALDAALQRKTEDMKVLAKEVSNLREELSEESATRNQMQVQMNAVENKLQKTEAERSRLELNFQQESDQRKRLQKNAEQQLNTITDRMNEIISLRQQISTLETQLQKAKATE